MAGSFPGAVTAYTNPTGGNTQDVAVGARTHSQFHSDVNDDLEQVMTKLGISLAAPADTPAADRLLGSNASGKSGWMQLLAGMVPNDLITAAMLADTAAPQKIAETTLGSSASVVTFSSIPSTFRSLRLFWSFRTDAAASSGFYLTMNNDNGANYTYQVLSGSGSSAGAFAGAAQNVIYLGESTRTATAANHFSGGLVDIYDYAATTHYKMTHGMNGRDQEVYCTSGMWLSTSAVNRIDVFPNAGVNFITNSRFTLYGWPQ